ncbi:MAG: MMPL family transporter [Pseudomonadales bacterium]|nr:MMPL family transporter [Pseudomonadales bacterium]
MTTLINAWARFVLAKRAIIIAVTIALLPVYVFTGGAIPFDNSTERYFVAGDPALIDYDRLLDLFGDNEYLVVGIEAVGDAEDVFTESALDALVRLSDFLEFHQYVTQLRSLSTFQYIYADGDDLRTDYLIEDIADVANSPNEISRVKEILANEPLAMDVLVTEDFRHTRIAARIEHIPNSSEHKVQIVQDLYDYIESENFESDDFELHLSGYPLVYERYQEQSAEDIAILVPIMVGLMMLILYVSFRSLAAMLFPWLVIASGLLFVLELQYYLGIPQTTIDSAALPTTLIIIGIGITVHVLLEFFRLSSNGKSSEVAAKETIEHIWKPAFFTALTTSAGFLALSVTRILPIREFALLGSIGPIVLFIFSLTVLPALLSYLSGISQSSAAVMQGGAISRFTAKIPDFTLSKRNLLLGIGIAIIAFTAINLPNAQVDNNYVDLFKESDPTRQDILYFDDEFKGMMTLDIILDSGVAEGIKDPSFLAELETIENWLSARDTLGPINSLADYLKEINQAFNSDDSSYYRLPDTAEMTAQFLLLYDSSGANEDLSDIKDFDNRFSRLVIPVVNMPASEMQVEVDEINDYLESNFSHLQSLLTGTMVLYTVQDMYTSEGMILSFLVALTVITVFFIVLFRSVKYGLLSIIPSVLPILLAASIAGFLGIKLDQGAIIVFAMTMGIAVDDAIHVMSRYLDARNSGSSTKYAIQRAMNESGRAVVFSSIVLVFGFSVLTFASFTVIIYIGMFGSIIMALALLGDLYFLPAILYLIDGTEEADDTTVVKV